MIKKREVVQIHVRESTDFQTGEVKSKEENKIITLPREPPYVKLYIEDLGKILGLTQGCKNLVYCLLNSMGYDGVITIAKGTRERFAEQIGVQERVVKNQITKLCKTNVIKRIGTGEYEMNPNYFAKGDWIDIRKRQNDFEMKIKYTKNGREITGKSV